MGRMTTGQYFKSVGAMRLSWLVSAGMLAYGICLLPLYFSNAYIADEWWFYREAVKVLERLSAHGLWWAFWHEPNMLGYGSLYWIGYGGLILLTHYALPVMRLGGYLSMLLIPVIIYRHGIQSRSAYPWFGFALWLTFPVAWWTAKLSGPELFSLVTGAVALYLTLKPQNTRAQQGVSFFLLGIATGIKLTFIPCLVFVFFVLLERPGPKGRTILGFLIGCAAGFLATNPFLLFSPGSFLEHVGGGGPVWAHALKNIHRYLWNIDWHWSMCFDGGFFNWGIQGFAFPVVVLFFVFAKASPVRVFAFLAAFLTALAMFFAKNMYFGWYWFPVILLIPFMVNGVSRGKKILTVFTVLILMLNLAESLPLIQKQVRVKFKHVDTVWHREEIYRDVRKSVSEYPGVIDYAGYYTEPELNFDFLLEMPGRQIKLVIPTHRFYRWLAWAPTKWVPKDKIVLGVFSKNMEQFLRGRDRADFFKRRSGRFEILTVIEGDYVNLVIFKTLQE